MGGGGGNVVESSSLVYIPHPQRPQPQHQHLISSVNFPLEQISKYLLSHNQSSCSHTHAQTHNFKTHSSSLVPWNCARESKTFLLSSCLVAPYRNRRLLSTCYFWCGLAARLQEVHADITSLLLSLFFFLLFQLFDNH